MKKFKFEINSRIEMEYEGANYKSTIQDVLEDGFLMSIPVNRGEYLTLHSNERVTFYNYVDGNNIYRVTCTVLNKMHYDNLPLYKLSLPIEFERIQRRNFVRVKVLKEIEYCKLDTNGDKMPMNKGMLLDISGGGVRVKCDEALNFNDNIALEVNINDIELSLTGEVVRIEKSPDNESIFGIAFKNQTLAEIDVIMKAVFNIMRKQRELI